MQSYAARFEDAWYFQLANLLLVSTHQQEISQLEVPCTFKPGCNDTSLANMCMQRAAHLCCKLGVSDGDTTSVTLS